MRFSEAERNINMKDENRRNLKITFRVTEEEKIFIIKKAKLSDSKSIGAYLRKMAITGVIVNYENQDLKKLRKSLVGIQKNINQMAIRVNTTSRMYEDDFNYLKEVLNEIWQSLTSIQSVLLSLKQ